MSSRRSRRISAGGVRRRVSDGDGRPRELTKREMSIMVLEQKLAQAQGPASAGGTYAVPPLRRTSTKKECVRCHRINSGFGDVCSGCRRGSGAPLPKECPGCGSFFAGFGEMCEECSFGED